MTVHWMDEPIADFGPPDVGLAVIGEIEKRAAYYDGAGFLGGAPLRFAVEDVKTSLNGTPPRSV